jgi:hypothetical protein
MLYGVVYSSHQTAIHGIILYRDRKQALEAIGILSAENGEVEDSGDSLQGCFDKAYAVIDEIDYRKITEKIEDFSFSVNHNVGVSTESEAIDVVNFGKFLVCKVRRCNRCENIVYRSELEEYEYSCNCCDEDLYKIETYIN